MNEAELNGNSGVQGSQAWLSRPPFSLGPAPHPLLHTHTHTHTHTHRGFQLCPRGTTPLGRHWCPGHGPGRPRELGRPGLESFDADQTAKRNRQAPRRKRWRGAPNLAVL